ncbi:hypothetical protein [Vibrio parahaemolyticus]|uniref:hypothetical protein n=1 Tax=Vibrio parahaemolyticus TaxID=670 RepID=UPI003100AE4C
MALIVGPKEKVGRNGGSFQEVELYVGTETVKNRYKKYCTIRDHEYAPPTSTSGRKWEQIFRTPDSE